MSCTDFSFEEVASFIAEVIFVVQLDLSMQGMGYRVWETWTRQWC